MKKPEPGLPRMLSLRDAAVCELELAERARVQPELLDRLAHVEPGRVGRHQERGDPGGPALGPRLGVDGDDVGERAAGDPDLLAVDDVLVAVLGGGRGHRGRVRPRARLRDRVRAQDLAVDEPRQVALLELVRPELLQRDRRAHDLRRGAEQQSGVPAPVAEVLEHVDERQHVEALTAPLRVERDPQHAGLADQVPFVAVEPVRRVILEVTLVERLEVLVQRLPERLLLVGPFTGWGGQCHPRSSSTRMSGCQTPSGGVPRRPSARA